VICNISVYLYERLQRAEFQARKQLQQEQQKSERLLLNILPSQIAERLKKPHAILADDFAHVTVLFADIVGFTEISAKLRPPKLVELLNEVFSIFDHLVAKHGVEKIKTIGDAYMVVAGLPAVCDQHVSKIADLALDMQQAISEYQAYPLSIRIGIHTGPVVAGVIGIRKIAYDLWGDTVNLASRMESQGLAGQTQVSDSVYEALKDEYWFEERGCIQVKGKGEMTTYILRGVKPLENG
jgi:class 3 adenylate cyclase